MQDTKSLSKHDKLISSAVGMLESKGFENIRADLEEYEKPAELKQTDGKTTYIPDITAYTRQGKCYFEIVSKDKKNESQLIGKWKLFSRLANLRNGTFFLLAPRGTLRFATQLIDQHNIEADILKLQAS